MEVQPCREVRGAGRKGRAKQKKGCFLAKRYAPLSMGWCGGQAGVRVGMRARLEVLGWVDRAATQKRLSAAVARCMRDKNTCIYRPSQRRCD